MTENETVNELGAGFLFLVSSGLLLPTFQKKKKKVAPASQKAGIRGNGGKNDET